MKEFEGLTPLKRPADELQEQTETIVRMATDSFKDPNGQPDTPWDRRSFLDGFYNGYYARAGEGIDNEHIAEEVSFKMALEEATNAQYAMVASGEASSCEQAFELFLRKHFKVIRR